MGHRLSFLMGLGANVSVWRSRQRNDRVLPGVLRTDSSRKRVAVRRNSGAGRQRSGAGRRRSCRAGLEDMLPPEDAGNLENYAWHQRLHTAREGSYQPGSRGDSRKLLSMRVTIRETHGIRGGTADPALGRLVVATARDPAAVLEFLYFANHGLSWSPLSSST